MIALLREAGGFGDCICVGAAARAIKKECDEPIAVFCPDDFEVTYNHLAGIDAVWGLGSVKSLSENRRPRSADLSLDTLPVKAKQFPYLERIIEKKPSKLVDLFCPGRVHEVDTEGHLWYNRAELFCLAAGSSPTNAHGRWICTEDEIGTAKGFLKEWGLEENGFISAALRGTGPERTYPTSYASKLMEMLTERYPVVYHDCITPYFEPPRTNFFAQTMSFPLAVAVASLAKVMLTVDTSFIHLAAALEKPAIGLFGPTDSVTVKSYPTCRFLESKSENCPIACNYRKAEGWQFMRQTNRCKDRGCERMLNLTPDKVACALRVFIEEDLK